MSDSRLGVPSFIAHLDVREPLLPGFTRNALAALRPFTPAFVVPRSLFLGTPFERYDQSHLLDEITEVSDLCNLATEVARYKSLEMVVVTNVSPEHPRIERWQKEGFIILPSFPDTLIDLNVDSFDAHLARIPAGDRSGVRRNIRKFNDAGFDLKAIEDSEALAEDLYQSYLPLFKRATVRWQIHTKEYFASLSKLSKDVKLTGAYSAEGDLAGFVVNFVDGIHFQAGRVGIHPQWHRQKGVYFRLIYHLIEEALQESRPPGALLSLEPTGYRMKRHLGARAKPMVNLVKGVSASWRLLLSGFAGFGHKLLSHLEDRELLEQSY